jgi:glyoxylase-like metal-dependent hydrolase (beta-lactamase superfamily II)
MLRPHLVRTFVSMLRDGLTTLVSVADIRTFRDRERLDIPGHPMVIQIPGHTPGACALHVADRGVLFSGDALVTRGPFTGATPPRVMPTSFSTDSDAALEALRSLEGFEAQTILPGHGEPWPHGIELAIRSDRNLGRSF